MMHSHHNERRTDMSEYARIPTMPKVDTVLLRGLRAIAMEQHLERSTGRTRSHGQADLMEKAFSMEGLSLWNHVAQALREADRVTPESATIGEWIDKAADIAYGDLF